MKVFKNKTVFLPGGSMGIGLSAAKQLAALGANVFIFARTKEKLESALKEIKASRKSDSQKCGFMQLDIGDNKIVKTVMEKAVSEFGIPDLLINCAGRAYPHYFEDVSFEQFDDTMKTNLYGIWNSCSALVPHMKVKGGAIVNVSSMVGFVGVFGYTDYAASKFGIVGFSEALKSEMKKYNITVQVLCPPDTDTPGFATENLTKPAETKAISASAKVLSSDEVAKELIEGIKKGTFMIIPGFDGKMTYFMKRHCPAIVNMVMDSTIKKAQKY